MKISILQFICMLTILSGCTQQSDKVKSSNDNNLPQKSAEIREFEINEILKPLDIALGDNYLCILSDVDGADHQIYVYDADNMEFKYKFAKKGSGPQETLALDMVKTLRGDTLYLIDQSKYKMLTYKLQDDQPIFISECYLNLPHMGPLQEVYWSDDSTLIFNTLNGDLVKYSVYGEEIEESFDIPALIENISETDKKRIGNYHFSCSGDNVYIGMRSFNELFKCKLDSLSTIISDGLHIIENPLTDNGSVLNNYVYYVYVASGKEYVLAQYYGRKLIEMQPFPRNLSGQNLKFDLELFDRNLNPIRKFQTNTDFLRAFLDEKRHRIYYWDANNDFEELKYLSF